MHHAAGKQRNSLFQKLVHALAAVIFCNDVFFHGMGSFFFEVSLFSITDVGEKENSQFLRLFVDKRLLLIVYYQMYYAR